ncbi:hypothetical protein MKEN_00995800 [Mycena kentingensis (nom. inval.)]|nr:hypothetical protein MKEN_00995800 [Mycena kentingensis (nom. inval.)]
MDEPLHRSLTPRALNSLPLPFKRVATLASRPDADPETITRLFGYLGPNPSASAAINVLPIVYVHLAAAIPSRNDVIAQNNTALAVIARAEMCLAVLLRIYDFPELLALGQLWPFAFRWHEFFVHEQNILGGDFNVHTQDLPGSYRWILAISARLCNEAFGVVPANHVFETDGFIETLVRVWGLVPRVQGEDLWDLLQELDGCSASDFLHPEQPGRLARFADGAGGSIQQLARLLCRTLAYIVDYPTGVDEPDSPSTRSHVCETLVAFVDVVDRATRRDGQSMGSLFEELLRIGFLPVLVRCGNLLRELYEDEWGQCRRLLLDLAANFRGVARGGVCDMLACGFGRFLVEIDTSPESDLGADDVNALIKVVSETLPAEFIRLDCVRAERKAREEKRGVVTGMQAHGAELLTAWKRYRRLAGGREEILEMLESVKFSPPRACDNLLCAATRPPRKSLRRCSGCNAMYYCSVDCQRRDWKREGGHSDSCSAYAESRIILSPRFFKSYQQRTFLRGVLDQDYTERWVEVYAKHIEYILGNPAPTSPLLVTVFDFTLTEEKGFAISVLPASADLAWGDDPAWAVMVARASSGRFQLHVARLYVEDEKRDVVIPLRSAAGVELDLNAALLEIADKARPLGGYRREEAIERELKRLKQECSGMQEIH